MSKTFFFSSLCCCICHSLHRDHLSFLISPTHLLLKDLTYESPLSWMLTCPLQMLSHASSLKYSPLCSHRRRQWQPTLGLLPGKSHGRRSLVGYSPWGRQASDMTERLHFPFSLSCIGEGNGNPLQCSCLENPRDGRAWWAAVYRVTQSDWSDLAAAATPMIFLASINHPSSYT